MARKTWIKLKRGLIKDPKHRRKIAECSWTYFHIIDRANWETGIIDDWKDDVEADDMDMPVSTLRRQRQKLEGERYIATVRQQYGLQIVIIRWQNPRRSDEIILNHPYEYWPDEFDPPDMGVLSGSQNAHALALSAEEINNQIDNQIDNQIAHGRSLSLLIPQNHIPQDQEITPPPRTGADARARARAQLFRLWETEMGPITPFLAEQLNDLEEDVAAHIGEMPREAPGANMLPGGWIAAAVHEARLSARGPNFRYVRAIVDRWIAEGYQSPLRDERGRASPKDIIADWKPKGGA